MERFPNKYTAEEIEEKWRTYWQEHQLFVSQPNPKKKPYTIVMPPPNITGVLHMGHVLNIVIQDVLVRRARMQGREACWIPGTDHASIATEAKVVEKLREKNIEKKHISREEFVKYAWEWKEKYGNIIVDQLKYMGASCDWSKACFTMDEKREKSVIRVFIDLYQQGYIYKDKRMIHWDSKGQTALSDEEVVYKPVNGKLCYIRYPIVNKENTFITIATTRPETIMADTAICVHPEDERYTHFIGEKAYIPLINREIPIISDNSISMEFGTGCLKVTPAHSQEDYLLGKKHQLPMIDILNQDNTLNQDAEIYCGKDIFSARKLIIKELQEKGFIEKIENHQYNMGFSERTNGVVEPRLSQQWFVRMKQLCQPALQNVLNDTVRLFPNYFKNTYRYWMENIQDWCISRQLWWGHRIPAYYLPDGKIVVAKDIETAFQEAKKHHPSIKMEDITQESDVLDTWFSSAIWPISVFEGILSPENEKMRYYYPTHDLVTAPEILFFWVARMIIMGYKYTDNPPFYQVYLTGIVRDKKRQKMSKSLGNSPDPIVLMKKYGTDGVRVAMLFSSSAGNDLLFDEKLCLQGRNFMNKLWNSARLILQWESDPSQEPMEYIQEWFEEKLHQTYLFIEEEYKKYRISQILIILYKLFWDDFCAVYLECIKPRDKKIHTKLYQKTCYFFETLLQLFHPFIPFITEELWHRIAQRDKKSSINYSPLPSIQSFNPEPIKNMEKMMALNVAMRNFRIEKKISFKEPIDIIIKTKTPQIYKNYSQVLRKLAGVRNISFSQQDFDKYALFIQTDKITIDNKNEVSSVSHLEVEKELVYMEGFLKSVMAKLNNEKFIKNAPKEVIEREEKKKQDTLRKIQLLKKSN